jgi:hypothetical protein
MPLSPHLQTIHRGSRILAPVCLLAAIAWPLLAVGWVVLAPAADLFSQVGIKGALAIGAQIQTWQRLAAAACAGIPALAASAAMWALWTCLRCFGRGEYFSTATVGALQRFAGWTFVSVVLSVIEQPIASVLLSFGFPPGQRQLVLAVGSPQFGPLLVAGTVWVIAGAMAEARRLADENAQFV